jgi:hypothetical protein
MAIILLGRQRRLTPAQPEVLAAIQGRLDELEDVDQRLAEVEERLDRVNRLLDRQQQVQAVVPPPPAKGA